MSKMPVFTKNGLALDVPKIWRQQYPENGGDKYEIWKKLKAEKHLTPELCEKIIGNNSWTSLNCDQCERSVDWAIQLGQEPDYESRTALICRDCLKEAVKKI